MFGLPSRSRHLTAIAVRKPDCRTSKQAITYVSASLTSLTRLKLSPAYSAPATVTSVSGNTVWLVSRHRRNVRQCLFHPSSLRSAFRAPPLEDQSSVSPVLPPTDQPAVEMLTGPNTFDQPPPNAAREKHDDGAVFHFSVRQRANRQSGSGTRVACNSPRRSSRVCRSREFGLFISRVILRTVFRLPTSPFWT
jgi:hypothetical protein